MVRTDQMWRYPRTVKLMHYHSVGGDEIWETLVAVTPSPAQGWNFELEDGCVLQSCFDETEIEVQTIWHEDVLNWGKQPA